MKDYYEILGVAHSASKEDVKRAYRKLAHQYHPDKKGGDEKKFKEINEAYRVLGDDQRRARYDKFGDAGLGAQGGFSANSGSAAGWGFDGADIGDIFEEFFSGLGGFGRAGKSGFGRRSPQGADIALDLDLSFAESIFGSKRAVVVE